MTFGNLISVSSVYCKKRVHDYEADKVTTGFGQGIYVTPYQMMQAFTAIANDGNMMK